MVQFIIGSVVGFLIEKFSRKKRYKRIVNEQRTMVYGLPGSGKTSHAAYIVSECNKFGVPVFSNVSIHGSYKLGSISKNLYPEGSVLIIDEAGLEWSNRDFRSTPKEVIEFFKMSRHYRYTVYLYSQSFDDVDIKIRSICDNYIKVYSGMLQRSLYCSQHLVDTVRDGLPSVEFSEIKWYHKLFAKRLNRKKYYSRFDSYSKIPRDDSSCDITAW